MTYLDKILVGEEGSKIAEPMNRTCRVAVLVPVLDEPLEILMRLLKSLAGQEDVAPENYEVVFIVNNSKQQAQRQAPEFLQNLKIAAFINFISRKQKVCPFVLSPSQKAIVGQIKKQGMIIRLIDKTSIASAYSVNNCGAAKNRAGAEICQRFLSVPAGKNGIIAMTDCDCRVSPNYLKEILLSFKDPKVNLVAGRWLTEADPSQKHSEFLEQAMAIHFGADNTFKNYTSPAEKLPLKYQKRDQIKKSLATNGHNMAVRVGAWMAVGGFPHFASFDDVTFGWKVLELPGDVVSNRNFWICNLMRVSERAGAASIGRRVKSIVESIEIFQQGKDSRVLLPDLRKMAGLALNVRDLVLRGQLTPETLSAHLAVWKVEMDGVLAQDILELCKVINTEYLDSSHDHGWVRTEKLVLEKFYHRLPKLVLSA